MRNAEPLPANDRDLEDLLRKTRAGAPAPDESTPWDFVFRWPGDFVRDHVWPVVSRLLVDDDATTRQRSIEFIQEWPGGEALTTPRLVDVAERHLGLFGAQGVESVPLRHSMAHALANRADGAVAERIARVLQRMAADGPLGGGASSVIARHDPAFVIARSREWGDEGLEWTLQAVSSIALYWRDLVLSFLEALRGVSVDGRERVLRRVEQFIQRDDAEAAAMARSVGLTAPTRPAPSPEDCRKALAV